MVYTARSRHIYFSAWLSDYRYNESSYEKSRLSKLPFVKSENMPGSPC